jgi:hypothetical protein
MKQIEVERNHPLQDTCNTRGGYKTENGQEVFLCYNGNFAHKKSAHKNTLPSREFSSKVA